MNDDLINTTLIAERRRELNMTARTLAKAAAVPQAVLYPHQPKAGAGYNITLGELARIAAVLAVSPADLLRRPADAPQEPFATVTFHGEGGTQPGVDLDDSAALLDLMESGG